MSPIPTRYTGIECPVCCFRIISLSRYHYQPCPCGYCFVDGGREYMRVGWGIECPNGNTPGSPNSVSFTASEWSDILTSNRELLGDQ